MILLRGAMDGLTAVAPYGDPDFLQLERPGLPGQDGYHDLDGFFALHPSFAPLLPLWRAGELAVVHAVATPYRDQRSHFDGQDILEFGETGIQASQFRSGWLNRLLNYIPGASMETACEVGSDPLPILQGRHPVHRWAPDVRLEIDDRLSELCLAVTSSDEEINEALQSAFGTLGRATDLPKRQHALAAYAAQRLSEDARLAAFAIDGWDTHSFQQRNFARAADQLTAAILTLRDALRRDLWANTTIVAITEFGRTVRLNGTGGTDHGTAGATLLAGGAVNGGRVYSDWPGLAEEHLYDRRDLMPTRDVRAYLGWALRKNFGLATSDIEAGVFPGLELGGDPGIG